MLRGHGGHRAAAFRHGAKHINSAACIGHVGVASQRSPASEIFRLAEHADAEHSRRESLAIRKQAADVLPVLRREVIDAQEDAQHERRVFAEHEVPTKLADGTRERDEPHAAAMEIVAEGGRPVGAAEDDARLSDGSLHAAHRCNGRARASARKSAFFGWKAGPKLAENERAAALATGTRCGAATGNRRSRGAVARHATTCRKRATQCNAGAAAATAISHERQKFLRDAALRAANCGPER